MRHPISKHGWDYSIATHEARRRNPACPSWNSCCTLEKKNAGGNMREIADADILPLSLEHNFWTWSAQGKVQPIPVTRAEGVYFWDADGKRYLDLNSMTMC